MGDSAATQPTLSLIKQLPKDRTATPFDRDQVVPADAAASVRMFSLPGVGYKGEVEGGRRRLRRAPLSSAAAYALFLLLF